MLVTERKSRKKTGLASSNGKDPNKINQELLQEGEKDESGKGEASDSDGSVVSVKSTESQKARRASPKSSPSKRLLEFVTVQDIMVTKISRLISLEPTDRSEVLYKCTSTKEWENLVHGYWFSQNITVVHQEKLKVGFWLIEWKIGFDKGISDLFSGVFRMLCVTEVSDVSFKVRSLMLDDLELEEEYVPLDAYFHIAKKGMASHVKVLDMLQDLNSFPEFACLDRHDALQEELEMNTTMAHKAKIRKLVQEATDQVMDEAAVITHKGLAQPRQLSSSSTEFMGMAVALRDSGKIDIRAHNLKIYQLVVNIQPGNSVQERIRNASKILGDFDSQKISISDARKSLELVFARSGNRQDLLRLAPFDFKAEALFLGSCGT